MPRYYFHLHNRVGTVVDEQGRELPDLEAGRAAAIEDLRSILSEEVKRGRVDLTGRIDVIDGDGRVLLTVRGEDAVDLRTS